MVGSVVLVQREIVRELLHLPIAAAPFEDPCSMSLLLKEEMPSSGKLVYLGVCIAD